MREERLKEYLQAVCLGRRNILKSTDLEQMLGIRRKEQRKLVNRLRRKGVPIASSSEGYYYAQTAGEVYSTIRQLNEMKSGLEAAIRGLEQALDSFGEAGAQGGREE